MEQTHISFIILNQKYNSTKLNCGLKSGLELMRGLIIAPNG